MQQLFYRRTPIKKYINSDPSDRNDHSAPDKILLVVEHLLNRTRKIMTNARSCQDAIHAAILSLEAKELLYGQSMTMALESLSHQQQMEVMAECSFHGIAHQIMVVPRIEEIAKQVDNIIRIEETPNKLSQSFNAQIGIINNFHSVFKDFDQFDEDDRCLDMIRRLRQGLHFFQHQNIPLQKLLSFLRSSCIERYVNFLIRAPWCMIISMIVWITIFTFVFYNNFGCILNSFFQSSLTFFMLGLSRNIQSYSNTFFWISLFEIIIAYFHLGLFVAYIYQKISRR